mmetsp:Transcript_6409/g.26968  ORF Transcript_6409/g.26968 Transcript_6409/m.26968 type:complete len:298 (-) Transcript_6409:1478-2371(-)
MVIADAERVCVEWYEGGERDFLGRGLVVGAAVVDGEVVDVDEVAERVLEVLAQDRDLFADVGLEERRDDGPDDAEDRGGVDDDGLPDAFGVVAVDGGDELEVARRVAAAVGEADVLEVDDLEEVAARVLGDAADLVDVVEDVDVREGRHEVHVGRHVLDRDALARELLERAVRRVDDLERDDVARLVALVQEVLVARLDLVEVRLRPLEDLLGPVPGLAERDRLDPPLERGGVVAAHGAEEAQRHVVGQFGRLALLVLAVVVGVAGVVVGPDEDDRGRRRDARAPHRRRRRRRRQPQ